MEGVRGAPKYREGDMPIPAIFKSDKREFIIQLERCEVKEVGGQMMPDRDNTGCTVFFLQGQVTIYNRDVFEMMIKSEKHFGNAVKGYVPHPDDVTGFWEKIGVIKEIAVVKKVVVAVSGDSAEANVEDILKSVTGLAKKQAKGEKVCEPGGQLESGAGGTKE